MLGMVLIWRLVDLAMRQGIDGVVFCGGIAAIAGLGGYEVKWLVDAIRAKGAKKDDSDK